MFPGVITDDEAPVVQEGLPSLNAEMQAAGITTPRRIAAFLTTLRFESRFRYNIHQLGDTRTYAGRGFIQLTGSGNYEAAGKYFGIDLLDQPDLALSLRWSAPIARWYWTVARPSCNAYADQLRMGKINAAIGYPRSADGSNDQARCLTFQAALKYLTGSLAPEAVDCAR